MGIVIWFYGGCTQRGSLGAPLFQKSVLPYEGLWIIMGPCHWLNYLSLISINNAGDNTGSCLMVYNDTALILVLQAHVMVL